MYFEINLRINPWLLYLDHIMTCFIKSKFKYILPNKVDDNKFKTQILLVSAEKIHPKNLDFH